MGKDRIIQTHDGVVAALAHFELHGKHRQARLRHRKDMFHALYLGKHLLGGRADQMLHFLRRGAGKRDKYIGESDIDLRLFLPRRHQYREQAEQQTHQRQQRRDLGVQKLLGDRAGKT
jgi:hypothetical protein